MHTPKVIDILPGENWKYYPYSVTPKKFLVSNLGRVAGNMQISSRSKKLKWRLLQPKLDNGGYLRLSIWYKNRDSIKRGIRLHILVLETFKGRPENSLIGRHLDDDRLNCKLDNLSWGTYKENTADAIKNGVHTIGHLNGQAIFTPKNIQSIFKKYNKGASIQDLCSFYKCDDRVIRNILNKTTYVEASKNLPNVITPTAIKITKKQINYIRNSPFNNRELSDDLGVSIATIRAVRNRTGRYINI